jgi:hypothetical protein
LACNLHVPTWFLAGIGRIRYKMVVKLGGVLTIGLFAEIGGSGISAPLFAAAPGRGGP